MCIFASTARQSAKGMASCWARLLLGKRLVLELVQEAVSLLHVVNGDVPPHHGAVLGVVAAMPLWVPLQHIVDGRDRCAVVCE